MPKIYSKDKLLMREMWRKALRERGLEIDFETEAHAHRARMMLYNAVKDEKAMRGGDPELLSAAESIEITFGESKSQLIMRPRSMNPLFLAMEQALGESMDTVSDPEAKAMEERFLRELDQLPNRSAAAAIDFGIGPKVDMPGPEHNPFADVMRKK